MMAGFRGKWKLKRAQIYGLLLFRRQVIMWILCTKFLLIGKFVLFILESLQRFLLVENCIVYKWPLNYEWERKLEFWRRLGRSFWLRSALGIFELVGGWLKMEKWISRNAPFRNIPSLGKIEFGKVQLQLFGRHISWYILRNVVLCI